VNGYLVGSPTTDYAKVWIDYNNDGDFSDDGEEADLGSQTLSGSGTRMFSANLTVPTDAQTGNIRMRVSLRYNQPPTPCDTNFYGEVEDYTVNHYYNSNLDDPCPGGHVCGMSLHLPLFNHTVRDRRGLELLEAPRLGRSIHREHQRHEDPWYTVGQRRF
jgi:hypothetical protein